MTHFTYFNLLQAAEGTGLAFIVFTQAMVEFPIAPFWAIMFFLMLLLLGKCASLEQIAHQEPIFRSR